MRKGLASVKNPYVHGRRGRRQSRRAIEARAGRTSRAIHRLQKDQPFMVRPSRLSREQALLYPGPYLVESNLLHRN